jgi:hypothetical protein
MKVLVIGLPKCGTRTLHRTFLESGLRSAHWRLETGEFCGELMYRGYFASGDPFALLEQYDCVAQADVCLPARGINYWPNLDFSLLLQIRHRYPACLFVLNRRAAREWIRSVDGWNDLRARLTAADIPGLPSGVGGADGELERWRTAHYEACAHVFGSDPRFVQFDIDDPDAPHVLGRALGRPLGWWGIENATAWRSS